MFIYFLLVLCVLILVSAGVTLYLAFRYELPEELYTQLFSSTAEGMSGVSIAVILLSCSIICLILMVLILSARQKQANTENNPDLTGSNAESLEAIIESRTKSLNYALERLDDAQMMADIGNFTWHLDNDAVTCSKNMYRLLKYEYGKELDIDLIDDKVLYPDDLKIITEWIDDGVQSEITELGTREHRLIRKDGEIIWVQTRARINYENGKPAQIFGSVQDITSLRNAELAEQERKDKVILYQETLASFIRHPKFIKMQYDELIGDVTKIISQTLDVSRVSVWLFETRETGAVIDLVNLWNDETKQHYHDIVLSENDFPSYFKALNEIRVLKYDDVYSEPEVAEFAESYFPENNITSMMDVPFYQSGELAGVICLEHTAAARHWTLEEQSFLLSIAEVVTIFYESKRRTEVENALKHAEKVEAMGQLTGGIAHDFNNMLGVIMGYSELLVSTLEDDSKEQKFAKQIQAASNRGARLTSNLLSFSRKKPLDQREINLAKFLNEQRELIQKTLTVAIDISFDMPNKIWSAYLDQSNLEHAILNLCINAQHAMEEVSNPRLSFKLFNQTVPKHESEVLNIMSGDYVVLSIQDNGCGIAEEQKSKIFDPYFSTKGDKGTGLGLSQVFSFIQEEHGAITVESSEGEGAIFKLYFPRFVVTEEASDTDVKPVTDLNAYRGIEKVVIVDDEEAICNMACEILRNFGYECVCFTSAASALKYFESDTADMVLTDVLMPQMDGFELCSILQQKYPELKLQLMSGYAESTNTRLVDEKTLKALIQKPFAPADLLKAIRELLDS